MTQQTNGMPDLNYSEENFRDLYEKLKEADTIICQLCKRLNPQHASSPYYKGCDWCQARESRLKALSKVETKNAAIK